MQAPVSRWPLRQQGILELSGAANSRQGSLGAHHRPGSSMRRYLWIHGRADDVINRGGSNPSR